MSNFFQSLRKAFFSGFLLFAPLGITLFVFNWLVLRIGGSFREQLLFFIPQELIKIEKLELVWNIVATVLVLILITLLGFFSRYFIAKYLWNLGERLLNNLPVINTVYTSVKQIIETFTSQNRAVFQKVALVPFPLPGSYAIGFTTGVTKGEVQGRTPETFTNVFVPTTPNPTSGFLIMFKTSDIQIMDMTVGEGMKLIISGGAVVPDWNKKTRSEPPELDDA